MDANPQLYDFLTPYSAEIRALTLELRKYITSLVPEANELIWDNYNAVAMAYSKSEFLKDAYCHLAVYSKHVNFGFNRGSELSSNRLRLEGKGALIRHIKVRSIENFPKEAIEKLVYEAVGISEQNNEDLLAKSSLGRSIVKSVSKKKIRPKQ